MRITAYGIRISTDCVLFHRGSPRYFSDICARIAENSSEDVLQSEIIERYWILTEKGKLYLEEHAYIRFFMEKHPYSLENIGLDINAYSKLFSGNPIGQVRDVLWGEFNRLSLIITRKYEPCTF